MLNIVSYISNEVKNIGLNITTEITKDVITNIRKTIRYNVVIFTFFIFYWTTKLDILRFFVLIRYKEAYSDFLYYEPLEKS
jgi:hypothetical protein